MRFKWNRRYPLDCIEFSCWFHACKQTWTHQKLSFSGLIDVQHLTCVYAASFNRWTIKRHHRDLPKEPERILHCVHDDQSDTRVFDVMHAAPSPLKCAFNVGLKLFWLLQVMNQSISWIYKQDVWLIWTYSAPKKEIGCPLMVEFSCQLNRTITNCLVNKTTTRQKGTALQVIKPP